MSKNGSRMLDSCPRDIIAVDGAGRPGCLLSADFFFMVGFDGGGGMTLLTRDRRRLVEFDGGDLFDAARCLQMHIVTAVRAVAG